MGRTYRHEKEWGRKPRKLKREGKLKRTQNNFFPLDCNEDYTPYEGTQHDDYYNEEEDSANYKEGKEK